MHVIHTFQAGLPFEQSHQATGNNSFSQPGWSACGWERQKVMALPEPHGCSRPMGTIKHMQGSSSSRRTSSTLTATNNRDRLWRARRGPAQHGGTLRRTWQVISHQLEKRHLLGSHLTSDASSRSWWCLSDRHVLYLWFIDEENFAQNSEATRPRSQQLVAKWRQDLSSDLAGPKT